MINQNPRVICHLCGAMEPRALFLGRDRLHRVDDTLFQIYRCDRCSLVFLFPQPTEGELQKYYPEDYGPYHTESSVLKYGALSRAVKKVFLFSPRKEREVSLDTSNARLLDFGCGGGAYLERMKALHPNWELCGFDTSEHACASAREKGFTVTTGSAETVLGAFKGHFDVIHMGHVIEHLPNPRATLVFLRTLLKPGGELHMSTPNVDSVAAKLFRTYWFALDTPRHLFLFSPKTISRLLSEVGFTTTTIQCTQDMGVEIRSINYLFGRSDMRIPFFLWHSARLILYPIGKVLSLRCKSSVMSVTATIRP